MPDTGGAWNPDGPAVIVDPYSSGALLAPAFAARGIEVVAVLTAERPPDVYAGSYRPADFPIRMVATSDLDRLAGEVAALGPRCVLAGCESGVELAEELAPRVVPQVSNVAALAAARRHKGAMAAAVAAAGLPGIAQICTSDPAQVAQWIHLSGLTGRDLVIKPPKSASTDGVTLVPGGQGWRSVFERLIGTTNRLGLRNDVLLVQEYATGTEYVVDTVSVAGRHTVTDVCRYAKITQNGHMAVYDTMEWIGPHEPEVAELVGYARRVLDAVGMRFGPAHIEIMLTSQGPRLIELGSRAHGGGQPEFCLNATGDSQIERTVRSFTEPTPVPDSYELRSHTMVVFHRVAADVVVTDIAPFAEIDSLASCLVSQRHVRTGDRLSTTKDLFGSLELGFVVLSHRNRDQVLRDYARIRELESIVFASSRPHAFPVGCSR